MLLATGEAVPKGQSVRARQLIVEVRKGNVKRDSLTDCQRAGHDGKLAAAMAAYVTWIEKPVKQKMQ
jgi:hypothetical protein